jgi:hypothetical protein
MSSLRKKHLHIKQCMETTYLANRFWLQAKKVVFNLYLTFVFLEMCTKPHNWKKWVSIAHRIIIKFSIKTEDTILTISTSAIFINKRDLKSVSTWLFGGSYLWFSTCYVDENTTVRFSQKYLLISSDSFSEMSTL